MAKHHPDLIFCRKQPGVAIGRLCEKCDGKCVICDSYVRPCTLVRICDECNYGSYQGRCVICGGPGVSDAYYCKECTIQEKDVSGSVCLEGRWMLASNGDGSQCSKLSLSFKNKNSNVPDTLWTLLTNWLKLEKYLLVFRAENQADPNTAHNPSARPLKAEQYVNKVCLSNKTLVAVG
ncbi:uncharacterized protein LOC134538945 isoform X1 [Bacillus rossius redtenbacheri]|uniref:uncharacterized protein LOC134538945 isoform X1 n=1 Tax=Bacillus rossius redtenbacheri TaxID=93214 RepID=UPI002FDE6E84